jgi:glycosyltransferase involved in cell wall biosynthesis
VNVAVVAEYYPRRRDPVLGVWAHRQALAARDAGADVRVLVLERPLPPMSALKQPGVLARSLAGIVRQPHRDVLDGIEVEYVRFYAPPREHSYAGWSEHARRPLARALARMHAARPFDLIHAHYALPAGAAAQGFAAENALPLVVSVHGGDVHGPLLAAPSAQERVATVLRSAAMVLCNSHATGARAAAISGDGSNMRVVHLGAAAPEPLPAKHARPTVATLGHVIARKRHDDVLEALGLLPDEVRWVVIGDGPELPRLRAAAAALGDRVEFLGQLPPGQALEQLARCHAMALPSFDEAFGVAYVEALACGVPAIGVAGEGGPEEIAGAGPGMLLVPPRDPAALADAIRTALADHELGEHARRTAAAHFSWESCGRETFDAYRSVL